MNNYIKYYIFTGAYNISQVFAGGAIIQSFLNYMGLGSVQISVFVLLGNVMQIVTMLLSVLFVDRIKNVPLSMAVLTLPKALFPAAMAFVSLFSGIPADVVFAISLISYSVSAFFGGVRTAVDYKLPYYVVEMKDYPRLSNVSGIIINILGTAVSAAFVFLVRVFPYKNVITVCFGVCIACLLVSSVIVLFFRENLNKEGCDGVKCAERCANMGGGEIKDSVGRVGIKKKRAAFSLDVLKLRSMRYLAAPNFLRGVASGIIGMAAVVMLSTVTDDAAVSSSLSIVSAAGSAVACFIYAKSYRRFKTTSFCLFGGIVMACSMSLMLVSGSVFVFSIMYLISYIGMTFVDFSIPIYICEIVPYEKIGAYTSVRMLLTTGGAAVGNSVAGVLADKSPLLLLISGAFLQITVVFAYYLYDKKFASEKVS